MAASDPGRAGAAVVGGAAMVVVVVVVEVVVGTAGDVVEVLEEGVAVAVLDGSGLVSVPEHAETTMKKRNVAPAVRMARCLSTASEGSADTRAVVTAPSGAWRGLGRVPGSALGKQG
jgi:hypothetical protein